MEEIALKIIQVSDLHISDYRNLLEPMISSINNESVDLVVITGDTVHRSDKNLFELAAKTISKINHKVVVIPGEYDCGALWTEYFGDRYKYLDIGDYSLEFLDTSSIGNKFNTGWVNCLDKSQHEWLNRRLVADNYHIVFSHHPFLIGSAKSDLFRNNLRAVYSGHIRSPLKVYFKYSEPKRSFDFGFSTTSLKFHGNSCYLLILVGKNDEIANVPRVINAKNTAWS